MGVVFEELSCSILPHRAIELVTRYAFEKIKCVVNVFDTSHMVQRIRRIIEAQVPELASQVVAAV